MSSNSAVSSTARSNGKRRLLSPSQKYEVFVSVLCGKAIHARPRSAGRPKVDRSAAVETTFSGVEPTCLAMLTATCSRVFTPKIR